MDERGNMLQQTDIVTLTADLLEVVEEGPRYIASVRFGGGRRVFVPPASRVTHRSAICYY